VDAHTQLPSGYTARGVSTLLRTGAASVGGIMNAAGRTTFQSAVARAYNSPFGLGGGAYHGVHTEGPAESAYLGITRKAALESVGLYDESLRRGEDWELNYRLRRAGHVVWLDPGLVVAYWPRDRPGKLARQFVSTGIWRGELVRRLGSGNSLRFFAPPLLVASIFLSVVVAILQILGVLHGRLALASSLVFVPPVLYLLLLGLLFSLPSSGRTIIDRVSFVQSVMIMHLCWGMGFLKSLLHGPRGATDTSRTS
jgi:succinoglycan biosynthesis protein ExoA